ncbi:VRR-NUC domain-containing protein [Pseudomonas sp. FFUP_PS_473]|uniref:VRR-NUC domain-containing protein n=1 Tax=Pseudomonas sp. FFUP_PS_473 TaxID=2060418 RepID=UPI000C7CC92C|nr:VRR-NUC domain-containing protein [Pseudomonas sp. FFUP_PS_473]PLP87633.1 VRR-NUC domain-containing protein [Pseudomonas sp. FFUP_PS_473]
MNGQKPPFRNPTSLPSAKKPHAKPVDREGPEQAALMREIELRYPQVFELIYHVPNGGKRHPATAKKLKEQGVKAGIPDLVLTMARGGYFGLYIEFKATIEPALVSASQSACLRRLNEQGYLAVVCRGHFDAMEQIRAYLRMAPTVVAA